MEPHCTEIAVEQACHWKRPLNPIPSELPPEVGNPQMGQLASSGGEGKEGVGGGKGFKDLIKLGAVVNETHEMNYFRFHQKLFCCQ